MATHTFRLILPLWEDIAASFANAPDIATEIRLGEEAADGIWAVVSLGSDEGEGGFVVAIEVEVFDDVVECFELVGGFIVVLVLCEYVLAVSVFALVGYETVFGSS